MLKVLIIDDSALMRRMISGVIKKINHNVIAEAKDGFEGVKLFSEHSPDLVLLDITMPNKDGRETLKEIMNLSSQAKVIMISAIKNKEVIQGCLNAGAKDFIEKSESIAGGQFEERLLEIIQKEFPSLSNKSA